MIKARVSLREKLKAKTLYFPWDCETKQPMVTWDNPAIALL